MSSEPGNRAVDALVYACYSTDLMMVRRPDRLPLRTPWQAFVAWLLARV